MTPLKKHLRENILDAALAETLIAQVGRVDIAYKNIVSALINHRLIRVLAQIVGTEVRFEITTNNIFPGRVGDRLSSVEDVYTIDYTKALDFCVEEHSLRYSTAVTIKIIFGGTLYCKFNYSIVGNNCGHVCLYALSVSNYTTKRLKIGYLLMRIALDILICSGFSYVTLSSKRIRHAEDEEDENLCLEDVEYLDKNSQKCTARVLTYKTETLAKFFGATEEKFYNIRSNNICSVWGIHLINTLGIQVDDKLHG